jgi:hypothetical protein
VSVAIPVLSDDAAPRLILVRYISGLGVKQKAKQIVGTLKRNRLGVKIRRMFPDLLVVATTADRLHFESLVATHPSAIAMASREWGL